MEIFKKMGEIMKEIPAIGKDRENKMQGFKFRGVEDVMNALQPIFAKHGVFTTVEVLDEKTTERVTGKGGTLYHVVLKCKVTFWAEDGSSVSAIVNGEAADSGDKVHAKCLSIAFKYACFTTFAIPTEEMPDPDAVSHEPTTPIAVDTSKHRAEILKTLDRFAGAGILGEALKKYMAELQDQEYIYTLEAYNRDKANLDKMEPKFQAAMEELKKKQ